MSWEAGQSYRTPFVVAPTAGIVQDEIRLTENMPNRTIVVSKYVPSSMKREHWSVQDFDLHKELYKGKTSQLFSATDRQSQIPVALKLYRKKRLSTLNKYQVEREIRIHIQLDHVNIIKLYAAFEDEKNVYMVQEYAAGGDLFEDLKRNGGSIKEKYTVRDIIVPFLNALQYLHGLGIIHRDIKPENILLTNQRVIKIADFGLSICYTQERPVTRAGTLDYMAPEVLCCPDKRRPEENKDKVVLAYTAQVDAWAVGILCFELLVGYPPFEQKSRAATYEHIMYKEPKFPAWMSEDAKRFITLALCKNATQRPTIKDLGQQPLILAYAKPVEKPPELRAPQEFLVERSPRSVLSSSPFMSATSTPTKATATLSPLAMKRPGALETEETGTLSDSHDGINCVSPTTSKGSVGSGMVLDEDASYSINDFTTTDDSQGSANNRPVQIMRVPSQHRMPGSPLAKSRLGSQTAIPAASALTAALQSCNRGSASPLARAGSNSQVLVGTVNHGAESAGADPNAGSYCRPQDGILSDDSRLQFATALSSGNLPSPIKTSASQAKGPLMERPALETLMAAGVSTSTVEQEPERTSKSLHTKIFGGISLFKKSESKSKSKHQQQQQQQVPQSPRTKTGLPRNLHEELLAERADSLLVTDRNGSVVGAPSMNFKKPSPASIQARAAVAIAAGAPEKIDISSDPTEPHKPGTLFAKMLRAPGAAVRADDLKDGLQRMNSEAMLARLQTTPTGSARSFTSANSPTMKKLANAPIVNKIQEYVQSHQQQDH